mgnify:CR=1 FL=1
MSDHTNKELSEAERQAYLDKFGVTPADASHDILLQMIEDQFANGLKTQVEPFPETDREFGALLDELRPLDEDQLREKLDISGWLHRMAKTKCDARNVCIILFTNGGATCRN